MCSRFYERLLIISWEQSTSKLIGSSQFSSCLCIAWFCSQPGQPPQPPQPGQQLRPRTTTPPPPLPDTCYPGAIPPDYRDSPCCCGSDAAASARAIRRYLSTCWPGSPGWKYCMTIVEPCDIGQESSRQKPCYVPIPGCQPRTHESCRPDPDAPPLPRRLFTSLPPAIIKQRTWGYPGSTGIYTHPICICDPNVSIQG